MSFQLNRFRADMILLFVAVVWGAAFVAQKTVLEHIGPMTFGALRFSLAALVIAPFLHREWPRIWQVGKAGQRDILLVALLFTTGTVIQQVAMAHVTVTNAGFLTTLYVVVVPFTAWALFGRSPGWLTFPAALLSFAGVFLLGGGSFAALGNGDLMIIVTAFIFAVQITLLGRVMQRHPVPATLAFAQCLLTVIVSAPLALVSETATVSDITAAIPELLFTGILSGGVAHLLQASAQAHSPPADAAIIMSSESLYAALFAALILNERLPLVSWTGCALIIVAILLVEALPLLNRPAPRSVPLPLQHPPDRG